MLTSVAPPWAFEDRHPQMLGYLDVLSYNAAMTFVDKLLAASRANKSLLCIGLDPDPDLMPDVSIFEFNEAIISATSDLVCAYKPNLAFYEALGIEGLEALLETIECIPGTYPYHR